MNNESQPMAKPDWRESDDPLPAGRRELSIWRMSIAVLLAMLVLPALGKPALADSAPPSPETLWEKIRATRLELDRAVEIRGLVLNTGMALFKIEHGILFPATPVGERTVEMVFQGSAKLVLKPPDEIEAGQLELFTGSPVIEERVEEAVLAINLNAAADAIFGRPPVAELDAGTRGRAQEIFEQWLQRPERRLFGVESAIFQDALGDPLVEGYFAGWFRGEELEEMLYLVDPNAPEQVTLGRFTTLDASNKEQRKLSRALHRQQRKGRLIGVSVADFGLWDTWLSASHRDQDGSARPGAQAFEPRHYELDLALTEPRFELEGRARLHLRALSSLSRIVRLELHSDLQVRRASIDGAESLFFRQSPAVEVTDPTAEVLVVLPRTPQQGEDLVLEIEYSGQLIDKIASKSFALRSTTHWYPHAGTVDRATYDVTLHWPAKLDLVAAGRLLDSGTDGAGRRFERRRLEHPTLAFGFEVGRFHTLKRQAGDVEVTLACDAAGSRLLDKKSREELLATVVDSLDYLEQTFGPYPLDQLVVVTAPRLFSQSLLGFVTLSSPAMSDASWLTWLMGFEDRRTVVAHELAHQWWGHVVSWHSYRDQWISEAMANYAAVLYARHRLEARHGIGPTMGWQWELTRTVEDGRRVESLGPLVLGQRLASSISADAYDSIVYKKGAVVLDMLAHGYGEDDFLEILRHLVQAVSFRQISTPVFFDLIERISGRDLGAFAQQFVYGTGLPNVFYSYTFARQADKWQVEMVARQLPPYRYSSRVEERPDGTMDVSRQRLDQTGIDQSTLYVPFQIAVYKPDVRQNEDERKLGLDPKVSGNARVSGRVTLSGAATELSFAIDHEPKELFLDPGGEVFGRFYNEHRHPKRMLFYQGLDEAAAGRHDQSEALYRRALTAEVATGPSYGTAAKRKQLEAEGRWLDARTRLQLVRLYLDAGRTGDARTAFDRLDRQATKSLRQSLGVEIRNLEARLAIREGDSEAAYRMLRKPVLKRGAYGGTEGLLLLAVAARDAGHTEDYETALEAAVEKGADVVALRGDA